MIKRLLNRSDFLACAASGRKWVRPSFVLQVKIRAESGESEPRLGFTTTKKLGNAVVRNRIRRRLREAARLALPGVVQPHCDYVLIGRPETATIDFALLQREMAEGMRKLHHLIAKSS